MFTINVEDEPPPPETRETIVVPAATPVPVST
jgi:hypothetical protein